MGRTAFFARHFPRFWKKAGSIEAFKFSLYLSIPVACSIFYANADFMHRLIRNLNLIEYGKEGPKPPKDKAELDEAMAKYRLAKAAKKAT